jgi:glycosyltransferase involved in cell wall biosynthesis
LIANSSYTRDRIARYYGRASEVICPPIDTARFEALAARAPIDDPRAPLLLVSALVPNKRVALAVSALRGRPERLIVVGEGPERARLGQLAGANVTFKGWVSDAELDQLYSRCRALLHPAVDDFGMVMAEALAAGKPVIACAEGGATDIVRPGQTGILIETPTIEGVRVALDRLGQVRFDPARLRNEARKFDRSVFERRFHEILAQTRSGPLHLVPASAPDRLAAGGP